MMCIYWYSEETNGVIKNVEWISKEHSNGREVWRLYNTEYMNSAFRDIYPDVYISLHVTVDPRS